MEVRFWVALDGNERVTINRALRGREYTCLECNGIMIPKKGEIKQHHFAHKSEYSCSGEGQKHLYVKELIYQILTLNPSLLYGGEVRMEKQHLGLQPDVSIHWGDDYLAIEVCDTSESSEIKKTTYGDNMVEFSIGDWGEQEIANPIFIFNNVYPSLFEKLKTNLLNKGILALERKRGKLLDSNLKLKNKIKFQRDRIECAKDELNGVREQRDTLLNNMKEHAKKDFEAEANYLFNRKQKLIRDVEKLEETLQSLIVYHDGFYRKYNGIWAIATFSSKAKSGDLCKVRVKKDNRIEWVRLSARIGIKDEIFYFRFEKVSVLIKDEILPPFSKQVNPYTGGYNLDVVWDWDDCEL